MSNIECYNDGLAILSHYEHDGHEFDCGTTYVYLEKAVTNYDAIQLDKLGWVELGPFTWTFQHDDN